MERARSHVSSLRDQGTGLDAFSRELTELLPRLRRFARALARDWADADDLVQRAVELALRRQAQFRPGTRLDSWMLTIMKNAWIDETRFRARRLRWARPSEEGERVADPSHSSLEGRRRTSEIEAAVRALPQDQRLAVALVLVEGLSYAEAAQVLEVPVGTLTSRLVRGRAALAAQLLDEGAP
jgi:RNA polymerase sigma factor (sigma-70 family)